MILPQYLQLGRAVVGCGHVTACVLISVLFFSTGHPAFLGLAVVAGLFAWWLLRGE